MPFVGVTSAISNQFSKPHVPPPPSGRSLWWMTHPQVFGGRGWHLAQQRMEMLSWYLDRDFGHLAAFASLEIWTTSGSRLIGQVSRRSRSAAAGIGPAGVESVGKIIKTMVLGMSRSCRNWIPASTVCPNAYYVTYTGLTRKDSARQGPRLLPASLAPLLRARHSSLVSGRGPDESPYKQGSMRAPIPGFRPV